MARIWRFVKKEAVLCIAAMCAVLTMFLVPPDGGYPGYIDLRVLCLLLCLMAVVAGFRSCGAFQWLACQLLSWGGRGRGCFQGEDRRAGGQQARQGGACGRACLRCQEVPHLRRGVRQQVLPQVRRPHG